MHHLGWEVIQKLYGAQQRPSNKKSKLKKHRVAYGMVGDPNRIMFTYISRKE